LPKKKEKNFKKEIEATREEVKLKIEDMKASFKENISKIKDENKKISSEKIITIIQALNTKFTGQLSVKIDQIENVLVGIESRISKADTNGIDTSLAKAEVLKAKEAITIARDAINTQTSKIYTIGAVDESTLRSEMKKLRDSFGADIKTLNTKIKAAHTAVKNTATTLAKVPKVDDDSTNKVEDNTINNNQ